MSDIGWTLRQARERRGLSLRQVAANTKIAIGALEALERNDVSKLPGGIFIRSFVRAYAAEVGLDPDQTVKAFLASAGVGAPRGSTHAVAIQEQESEFESKRRMAGVLLTLVAISVPLIVGILYFTRK
jgi:cytoskeletal protein RodZ